MARIDRSDSNLFPLPAGAYLRNGPYVYVNTSSKYVRSSNRKDGGSRGYTDHESVCIGVLADHEKGTRMFYANTRYRQMFGVQELPGPPLFADSLSVGLYCVVQTVAEQTGLAEDLTAAFGEDLARQILDCSHYMLSRESAVMQHYPPWAREHALFSDAIKSDTALGVMLKSEISISKINKFRDLWALRNVPDGGVSLFLCYDSTNVNCQASGVFIVQRGHAKDDPSLDQVNTDYVVRQEDGMPFTWLHSPGSVSDIAQAQEMIRFIDRVKRLSHKEVSLTLICDRGYISEKNLRQMDKAGIGYILMLRSNFGLYSLLADQVIDEIKSYKNRLVSPDGDEVYGVTRRVKIYDDGPDCFAQIVWSADRYKAGYRKALQEIEEAREKVEAFIAESKGKSFLADEELKWVPPWFTLETEQGEPRIEERKKRGRGKGVVQVVRQTVRILGYHDNEAEINREIQKAGIMVLITSEEMTAQKCLDEYSKRDCVEKTFAALKSHLGMDKIGVTTEEAMHGKGVIWFSASIIHNHIFTQTASLRTTNRKDFTVPAIVHEMEAIKADRDLTLGGRKRRYKLTSKQGRILGCWKLNENTIDEAIKRLPE